MALTRPFVLDRLARLGGVGDAAIDPLETALLLAWLDRPGTDVSGDIAYIDGVAASVRQSVPEGASRPVALINALIRQMSQVEGFIGDAVTYDDPDNANMGAVIQRRSGLPVALSILYVAVARRLGLEAAPLNLPMHVLVRIAGTVLDPFAAGRLLRPADVENMVARLTGGQAKWRYEAIEPMSNRASVVRLEMNLASRAEAQGRPDRCLEIATRMTLFAPQHPECWRIRLRMEHALEQLTAARDSLMTLQALTTDRREQADLDRLMGDIGRRLN